MIREFLLELGVFIAFILTIYLLITFIGVGIMGV